MLLAIDCGNTNTVFALWDGEKIVSEWRTSTQHQRTADEYYTWLRTLMHLESIEVTITEAIISSTVISSVDESRTIELEKSGDSSDTPKSLIGRPNPPAKR